MEHLMILHPYKWNNLTVKSPSHTFDKWGWGYFIAEALANSKGLNSLLDYLRDTKG